MIERESRNLLFQQLAAEEAEYGGVPALRGAASDNVAEIDLLCHGQAFRAADKSHLHCGLEEFCICLKGGMLMAE